MITNQQKTYISPEDYLAREETSPIKHEYIDGQIYAIDTANIYYYPDILVTCDPRDQKFTNHKKYPCLIVEVLSPKTEAFDRGDKFADYQQLETLQEYVLINQKRQRVECFRRNPEGFWVLQFYHPGNEINLTSIDFHTNIEALYEDVTFEYN